jgi:hypothetical protein
MQGQSGSWSMHNSGAKCSWMVIEHMEQSADVAVGLPCSFSSKPPRPPSSLLSALLASRRCLWRTLACATAAGSTTAQLQLWSWQECRPQQVCMWAEPSRQSALLLYIETPCHLRAKRARVLSSWAAHRSGLQRIALRRQLPAPHRRSRQLTAMTSCRRCWPGPPDHPPQCHIDCMKMQYIPQLLSQAGSKRHGGFAKLLVALQHHIPAAAVRFACAARCGKMAMPAKLQAARGCLSSFTSAGPT